MTDAELDRDWVPNGRRPLSTVARSFSQELGDIFRIDNSVSDLDQKVKQRRENVGKTTQELAELEARLREMEQRLNRNKGVVQPASLPLAPNVAPPPPPAKDESNKSRPGTARASQPAPGSGNMPPTPGPSEGDFSSRAHQPDVDSLR
ncbi:hypothetical protein E4U35_006220 [Claviceps purpurea]|nr:hypothetical protein E4U12_001014 [Claviceps purpurea]KAG6146086.1 hypothetical protein E4U38_000045 [Claviceps purpurea]KAG6148040.1 hypothetical protein E4U28_005427 [Claviceps purpurea]KAG6200399.1 hypothetical protein E4U35_006220 [Claviceps purpurea]KAG6226530.1 hypothetical protein E4U34_006840 [Claviceps purpurea]